MFGRWVQPVWKQKFAAPYVHIVFGARQTGNSTLLKRLLPQADVWLDFSNPAVRSDYLRRPEQLIERCRALERGESPNVVVVDEAQNVPAIFDAVQHLYDSEPNRWRFVLCGSSARKLRVTGANLLPGRSFIHHLYPLVVAERPFAKHAAKDCPAASPLPLPMPSGVEDPPFPAAHLMERLIFGELPGIATAPPEHRPDLLRAYCSVYLEEELRREALIKDWAAFARFLQLAAIESGQMLNYAKIAKDAGVTVPTVKNYYQLLEDMFMGFRVTAFSGSPRKSLLSTARFYFFDVGVRHAAAELPLEPATVLANPGPVLEQWVGIELWKRLKYLGSGKLYYLRTKAGAEVDFIIERQGTLIPIEVKWTDNPSRSDIRHLLTFLREHPKRAERGFLICRCNAPLQLDDKVTALPWFCL
ncbi:MAG: ATP-binding protein [Verrucomicrobiae bacterium]|nr:ATP-binding protein [Verrucomicrobiae bacterium]MDW7979736.1 ATP-binding protein [Verrucomicrobiales bacterium]